MSKQKFVTVLLSSWILLGVIGILFPESVQVSSNFVTETDNYIQIENDYYIAKVSKGWHGHISEFYIKPNTDQNIVALGQWNFIGGHETVVSHGDPDRISVDWGGHIYKESQTTAIVHQTFDTVVIRCLTEWKNASQGNYVDMTVLEYTAFYLDKPYYLVSSKRTYNEEIKKMYNNQYVFLFDQSWSEYYYRVNHNGTITEEGSPISANNGDVIQIWEAQYLQQYPWAMLYNSTDGKGHFSILLSANPHHTGIGMLGWDIGGLFTQYQIHYGIDSAKPGDSFYFSVISGVASDPTYVNNLATSLWSSDIIQADSDDWQIVSSNNETENDSRKSRIVNQLGTALEYYSGLWRLGLEQTTPQAVVLGHDDMVHNEWEWFLFYRNATNYYQMIGSLTGFSIPKWTWTENFTNVTWRYDWENKIRTEVTTEIYKDSDSYYQTYNFTTLATANITKLYLVWKPYSLQAESSYVTLSNSVLKYNVSSYYVNYMEDQGIVFKNLTTANHPTNQYAAYGYIYYYALDTDSDTEYAAGNSWIFRLLIQPFRRYKSQNLGYFGVDDITLPEDRKSENLDYHFKLSWSKFPIWDTSQPYRINHYGKGYIISEASATSDELTFTVVGESGSTSNIKLYIDEKGEPSSVSGASSWNYDSSTKTLTITVTHSSEQQVEIQWRGRTIIPSHVYFHLWQQNTYLNFASTTSLDSIVQTSDKLHLNQYWFSVENANLTISKFFVSYQLMITINAPSGTSSTTKVYVDDLGEPTSVYATNGTLTWDYEASTKTVILTVFHSSRAEIILDWRIQGDIDGDGDVDSDDLGIFASAYGSNTGQQSYNPEVDVNSDDAIDANDFYLFARNYGKSISEK